MVPLRQIGPESGRRLRTEAILRAPSPDEQSAAGLLAARSASSTLMLHSVLLSAVAGYVDAAAFVLLVGVFPNHLTGELVNDAIALSAGQFATRVGRLWVFPVFFGSVALATLVARALRHSRRKALASLLALVTVSLGLFSVSGLVAALFHVRHLPLFLSGACAVAAMGFQTALMRDSLTGSCPTTVMTGNLAQIVIEVVDQLIARTLRWQVHGDPPRSRFALVSSALLAFTGCAVLGAWLTHGFGALSVLLPTLVTAGLAVRAWRDERPRRAELPNELPWFTDDELWPDAEAPRALSQPYYHPTSSSVARLKVVENVEDEVQDEVG